MERVGIRELRNDVSRVVRRANAGERIIITVDGVPKAQIVPLGDSPAEPKTLDELIAAGLLIPPRSQARPAKPHPIPAPNGRTIAEILAELRDE